MPEIKKRKTGGEGVMSVEEAREQLNKEQLEKEIDTIKRTLKDKREYINTFMKEYHDLEEELYKLQKELERPNLLHNCFKERTYLSTLDDDSEPSFNYFYIIDIQEDKNRLFALRIVADEKIDVTDFCLSSFQKHYKDTLYQISSEEFIKAYNKVFEKFQSMLPQGE